MEVYLTSGHIQTNLRGTGVTTQAQTPRGHKAWKNVDIERLTWR